MRADYHFDMPFGISHLLRLESTNTPTSPFIPREVVATAHSGVDSNCPEPGNIETHLSICITKFLTSLATITKTIASHISASCPTSSFQSNPDNSFHTIMVSILEVLLPRANQYAHCTKSTCPVEHSVYGYYPSKVGTLIFLALFVISLFLHLFQGIKWRSWTFLIALAVGCFLEAFGMFKR